MFALLIIASVVQASSQAVISHMVMITEAVYDSPDEMICTRYPLYISLVDINASS